MKVSSRVDYALSCLIVIAAEYATKKPVSVKYIAEREQLETDYVEQLLIIMKKAGILKSVRGLKGGYLLSAPPQKITAFQVIKAFEGDVLELVCFRKKGRQRQCIHLQNCQIKKFWFGLRDSMESYLHNESLDELVALRNGER